MDNRKKKNSSILKVLISILAIGNLTVIFFLSCFYSVPEQESIQTVSAEKQDEIPDYSICLDTDTLTYDGTGDLDLMSGVCLLSPEGPVSGSKIFVSIQTGASLMKKEIRYSADTKDGRVYASRTLNLENYSGPLLRIPTSFPEMEESELDNILSIMPGDGSFYADDGYGHDITNSVTVRYIRDEDHPYIVHCTFTVTNMFNDSVSEKADIYLTATLPD